MVLSFSKKSKNYNSKYYNFDETSSNTASSGSRSSLYDPPASPTTDNKPINVLIVGQIYKETILTVEQFPELDTKTKSNYKQQRFGGNCTNLAEVLTQFSKITPYIMSSIGPKESSSKLISQLESKGIKTSNCFYRKSPTPSCYIIQCSNTNSRTVVSYNNIQDITKEEFSKKIEMNRITKTMSFEFDNQPAFSWVHFEGRNVFETAAQIDWLESKATREGWRHNLTISVELDKPDKAHVDILLTRGDVVFFSKNYAEKRGYDDGEDFLKDFQARCKPGAILFCTWGLEGALCLNKGDIIHTSPSKVQVLDSVGAGEAFIAGVIYCMSRGHTLLTTLKFAYDMKLKKMGQYGTDNLVKLMSNASILQSKPKHFENDSLFDYDTLTNRKDHLVFGSYTHRP